MKIVILEAAASCSRPLTMMLVSRGHEVTVLTRNRDKVPEIERMGARVAVGRLDDQNFLLRSLHDQDCLFSLIPDRALSEKVCGEEVDKLATELADSWREVIIASGITKVVHLSGLGARSVTSDGRAHRLHYLLEQILGILAPEIPVTFLRPCGSYSDLLDQIPIIKQHGFLAAGEGGSAAVGWVADIDVAQAAVEALERPPNRESKCPEIVHVCSDETTYDETARVLGQAIGRPDLKSVPGPPHVHQAVYDFTELRTKGFVYFWNPEAVEQDQKSTTFRGKVKLADFARDFAVVYHAD